MKVYVDELPKSCDDCKFQVFVAHYEHGWQHHERYCSIMKENYDCKCSKENCPLKSLAEHDKQVRKGVCDEVEKRIINYCRRQDKKSFQKSIEQIKVDLLTSINQIQGEPNET